MVWEESRGRPGEASYSCVSQRRTAASTGRHGGTSMTIAFPKPDEGVLARRNEILTGLARLVASEALVVSEDERRAFETDALTAYRKMPLAVVLPATTEEVSALLRFCQENGVKVVPRGAGTSLAGGAIPQEDAIVLGGAKMNREPETDF